MPASKETEYYKLSQFEPDDVPTWQGNYNEDMQKIDEAIHEASENGGDTVSVDAQDGKATITVTNAQGETKTEIKTITQEQSDKVDNLANIKKVGANLTLEEDGTLNAEESTVDFNELENRPKYGGQAMSGSTDIPDLSSAVAKNSSDIATNTANIATNATNITANQTAITTETSNREAADNAIQQQIDALISKTDVVDIVQNYAALQAYDTSKLGSRDVIEVLNDENHDNALSYYRWNDPNVSAWNWIGSIAPYYTKSEASGLFVPKTRTINGQSLADDVVITLPTKLSQLTNDSGFITSEEAAAAYVPQSRTINNKPLSGNVTLGAGDVGAVATSDFTITSQGQTRANNLAQYVSTGLAAGTSTTTQAVLTNSRTDLATGAGANQSVSLPMASSTQAGCVTAEDQLGLSKSLKLYAQNTISKTTTLIDKTQNLIANMDFTGVSASNMCILLGKIYVRLSAVPEEDLKIPISMRQTTGISFLSQIITVSAGSRTGDHSYQLFVTDNNVSTSHDLYAYLDKGNYTGTVSIIANQNQIQIFRS